MTQEVLDRPISKKKSLKPRLLPISYDDRAELASELRIPATYEEYIIPSLQQIIFVEQYWTQVMTYIRQPNGWFYVEKMDISDVIPVENGQMLLADIYQKIDF